MKSIRLALAAAALVLGGAAIASAQNLVPPARAARHGAMKGAKGGRHGFKPGAMRKALFRGITLTDAEKANVKAVHQKYAAQLKALHEQNKPQAEAIRAARQRGDTAALRALRTQNAGSREQLLKIMQAEQADLRSALTPANQAKFDANVAQVKNRFAKRAQRGKVGTENEGR